MPAVCAGQTARASTRVEHPPPAAGLELTYLANEGFLLEGGDRRVLVDALFREGVAGYPTLAAGERERLETAQPPYDRVDVVLATHHHADHFDPVAVVRHLRANPRAVFVSTPEASRRAREQAEPALHSRIRGISPEDGRALAVEAGGLRFEALGLHHGRDRKLPVANLGFLLHLGGVTLIHVGDTEATAEDLAPFDLGHAGLDVALVPTWLAHAAPWKNTLRSALPARRLVVMHVPAPDAPADWFGSGGRLEATVGEIRDTFPGAEVMSEPGARLHVAPAPRP
jgi:L-ascorbate metabolism protein UlaG (beta-lactamase superfamily)